METFLLHLKDLLTPTLGEDGGAVAVVAIGMLFVALLFVIAMKLFAEKHDNMLPRPLFWGMVVITAVVFTICFQISLFAFFFSLIVLGGLCMLVKLSWGGQMNEVMIDAGIGMGALLVALLIFEASVQPWYYVIAGAVLYAIGAFFSVFIVACEDHG